jgi:polysaccharide pyruvyl transferase WcaK-like protein
VCANTPCIGVVYDPKVRALLQSVGQNAMIDCEKPDDTELARIANRLFFNYEEVKAEIKACYEGFREDTVRDTAVLLELIGHGVVPSPKRIQESQEGIDK